MLRIIIKLLVRAARDERGLTAVEYAVLGGLIVAALATVTDTFESELGAAFDGIIDP